MKKTVLLLMLVLLLPIHASAFDLGSLLGLGGDKDESGESADGEKSKKKFLIHFKSGGTIETDNYSMTKDQVLVMMPGGALYFEKNTVKSIEEVTGPEDSTVQNIQIQPSAEPPKPAATKPAPKPAAKPAAPATSTEPTDDNGRTESWWRSRIKKVQDMKADAEARHKQAEEDWSRYGGAAADSSRLVPAPLTPEQQKQKKEDPDHFVQPMAPVGSQYDIIRFQDLRGAARVEMDRAKADMDEADRMLNDVIPEEARKAGAPPGWLR